MFWFSNILHMKICVKLWHTFWNMLDTTSWSSDAALRDASLLVVFATLRCEGMFTNVCGHSTDLRTRAWLDTCIRGGEFTCTRGMYICPHLLYRVSVKNGGVSKVNLWKSWRLEALEQRKISGLCQETWYVTGLWIKNTVLNVCVLVRFKFGVYLVHHP